MKKRISEQLKRFCIGVWILWQMVGALVGIAASYIIRPFVEGYKAGAEDQEEFLKEYTNEEKQAPLASEGMKSDGNK